MNFRNIQLKDIDPDLLSRIANDIYPYITAIVALSIVDNKPRADLIGSGTFIQVGDTYGVLTAYHVLHSQRYRNSEPVAHRLRWVRL